jgi:hypothetical protein
MQQRQSLENGSYKNNSSNLKKWGFRIENKSKIFRNRRLYLMKKQ